MQEIKGVQFVTDKSGHKTPFCLTYVNGAKSGCRNDAHGNEIDTAAGNLLTRSDLTFFSSSVTCAPVSLARFWAALIVGLFAVNYRC